MPKGITESKVIANLICHDCSEDIEVCSECGCELVEDRIIFCELDYSNPNKHYCYDCYEKEPCFENAKIN